MKKILLIALVFIFIAGCEEQQAKKGFLSTIGDGAWWVLKTTAKGSSIAQKNPSIPNSNGLQLNAYGPNIHMNQYGQAVTLKPDFGGVPDEHLKITQNAYGPGVHMDQYGRPVREYPWPKK